MGLIFRLLTGRIAGPLLAGLALALAVFAGVQTVKLGAAERAERRHVVAIHAPVTGWASQLAVCRSDRDALVAALSDQSRAVAGLAAQSETRIAASAKAASAARAQADSWRRQAGEVLAMRAEPGESACAAADGLILREAGT